VLTATAPTRIDFGGGWTDVPPYSRELGGCVCNLAIDLHAVARLAKSEHVTWGDDVPASAQGASRGATEDAARGADDQLARLALRRAGLAEVSLTLESRFPFGAGLGGSSAAGVAIAAALAAWRGEHPDRSELAERSRAVEVEELGVAGGFQDHYAAAYGGALRLDFGEVTHVQRIDLSPTLIEALSRQCIVTYTGRSRISGATITAVLDAYLARQARVTQALARMKELAAAMADALALGSLDTLGHLVDEHWQHQRSLHPAITTPEIELVLERGRSAGAYGGKALGASGGGCVVLLAPAERAQSVRAAVGAVSQILPARVDLEGVRVEARQKAGGATR